MIYTFDSRVRYSEIDHNGTMKLPALRNYFQDCSTFQSEDIGVGCGFMAARHRAWILSYWQVIIDRFPEMGEQITVGTLATDFKGFMGNRNFFMNDAEGNRVACANSVWVYMDVEKGRPAKPMPEEIDVYGREEPLQMPYEGRKILIPEQMEAEKPFPVRKYHIDTNEHVNNCQYVQMALEFLPRDLSVSQLRVDYKKSAVLGDTIYPRLAKEKDRIVAALCREDESPYAVLEFRFRS